MLTFSKYSKMYESDLGINPLSTYRSAPPVIVNVLPDPVCKQNISQCQTYCKLQLINLLLKLKLHHQHVLLFCFLIKGQALDKLISIEDAFACLGVEVSSTRLQNFTSQIHVHYQSTARLWSKKLWGAQLPTMKSSAPSNQQQQQPLMYSLHLHEKNYNKEEN